MLRLFLACLISLAAIPIANANQGTAPPNIVVILADDMGYGDVHAWNPSSKIPTPHLDRLAAEGMRFTDAHSPSAVCTPTRYGTLTGRYCWRTQLKRGVLGGYSPPLIAPDRLTIAGLLQRHGYHTAAIGKWHLGMDMPLRSDQPAGKTSNKHARNVDFRGKIKNGPTTRGFDYYFGVSASLDMPPYVFIENDRFESQPSSQYPGSKFPKFVRPGPKAENLQFDHVLSRLAQQASKYIHTRAKTKQPFFLYLPLTGPHKPVVPHPEFQGRTDLGPYADFVVNVDATVGEVLKAVDQAGIRSNTLVIFTSDNGSFMFRTDDPSATDHVSDPTKQLYRSDHHLANGPLRGTKADIYEGGHRVPYIARWPGHVQPGTTCQEPICHTDLFATLAEVVGASIPPNQAEDSESIVPLLLGDSTFRRKQPVIHHSAGGMFAIRKGPWKLIAGNGSGGRAKPKGKPFERPYQLYNLATDVGEKHDVAKEHPDIVQSLSEELERIRKRD